MISDIYVLAYSMINCSVDKNSFHSHIYQALPKCLADHLPYEIHLVSVEYKKDVLVDSLLHFLVTDMADSSVEPLLEGVGVESGYFHFKFESDKLLSMKRNNTLEFIFTEMQAFYITASFFCYLGEDVIHHFSSIHVEDISEPVDEFQNKNLNYYSPLLKEYLYSGEIPDEYAGKVAKMLLVRDL